MLHYGGFSSLTSPFVSEAIFLLATTYDEEVMSIRRLVANDKGILPFREWPILTRAALLVITLVVVVLTAIILAASRMLHESLQSKSLALLQQTSQLESIRLVEHLDRTAANLES